MSRAPKLINLVLFFLGCIGSCLSAQSGPTEVSQAIRSPKIKIGIPFVPQPQLVTVSNHNFFVGSGIIGYEIEKSRTNKNTNEYVNAINTNQIHFNTILAYALRDALIKYNFEPTFIPDQAKLSADKKGDDFSDVGPEVDFVVSPVYGTFGYVSGATSSAYEPICVISFQLYNVKTKKIQSKLTICAGYKASHGGDDKWEYIPLDNKYKFKTFDEIIDHFSDSAAWLESGFSPACELYSRKLEIELKSIGIVQAK